VNDEAARPPVFGELDLIAAKLLPNDWVRDVTAVVDRFARRVELTGDSSTSRRRDDDSPGEYDVVTGDVVEDHLPWLISLYRGPLFDFASRVAGQPLKVSESARSAVNINALRGRAARYEWHVDSNPVTGLLFASSHPAGSGGELVFEVADARFAICPRAGLFLAFDAREHPHTVLPLETDDVRISIPMNFYFEGEAETRPPDLDSYIFGEQ
jgi:hypothetical protein